MVWFRARPFLTDALAAAGFLVLVLVGYVTLDDASFPNKRPPDLLGAALILVIVAPLAWRRRSPVAAFAVTVAATIPYWVLNYADLMSGLTLYLLIYAVGAYRDRPASLYAYVAGLGVLVPVMVTGLFAEGEEIDVANIVGNVAIYTAAWAMGERMRNRRAYQAQLELRAEALEREQHEAARRALEDERRRIARELHDVVAHSMSVMVVQAGAARRVLDTDPAAATEALGQIETTGREAMTEMRRMLGVLRDGASDGDGLRAPQPGLDGLEVLVGRVAEAGIDVTLDWQGERRPLPAGVDLSAYRIVQEALTNTVRHAEATRARVTITFAEDAVEVAVVDDGRGAAATATASAAVDDPADGPAGDGAGHGIVGMHERAALVGGTVSAGPAPGGGFAVQAHLPLAAPAATTVSPTAPVPAARVTP
ncbi:MAG: sensor histidine kinase [Acidimicrobiales bacterium]